MQLTDLELIEQIKNNKLEAFNKLFLHYYQSLCRYACNIVNDETASEDLVQDLFIHIWENRQQMNIHSSVKAFLYTSIRNRSINFLKSKKARKNNEGSYSESVPEISENIEVETNESLEIIEQAVNNLPEKCREIFLLNRQQNMKYHEIATHLSISPKTVENQMGIALKKLREYLHKHLEVLSILLSLFINLIFY